jgi:hypothetical protein
MSGGAHDSLRPPRPGTPTPPFLRFPLGRPLCGDESRADVRWVRAELFNPRPAGRCRRSGKRWMGEKCDGGPAGGPGRNRYTVQRPRRWLSRTDVMWGPRFSSTAPGPGTPTPHPSDFPVGRPLCGGECRADVRWVRARLFNRRPQAGIDGPESGRMRNSMRPGGRPRSGSVRSTTLATLAEQNRCQVGPTILFDRPRPGTPTPLLNHFPLGRPLCGGKCRADVRRVRRNFSIVARMQVPTVREADEGNAMAARIGRCTVYTSRHAPAGRIFPRSGPAPCRHSARERLRRPPSNPATGTPCPKSDGRQRATLPAR